MSDEPADQRDLGHLNDSSAGRPSSISRLRRGMLVQVKTEQEIAVTLDENGAYEGLPFTAQMWSLCGGIYEVLANVNRLHIDGVGVRGIKDTVILKGVKCNGEAHGGCDRACQLLLKKVWLTAPRSSEGMSATGASEATPRPAVIRDEPAPCQGQSSVLVDCSFPLPIWRIDNYPRDVFSGQLSLRQLACVFLFRLSKKWDMTQPIWVYAEGRSGRPEITRMFLCLAKQRGSMFWSRAAGLLRRKKQSAAGSSDETPGSSSKATPAVESPLKPGDLVEVLSKEELLAMLGPRGESKGLAFGGCALKYCGHRYRVAGRVNKLIDEKTGKRIEKISNTVILEGAICDGISFWGCPRACYWFFREAWLRKIDQD